MRRLDAALFFVGSGASGFGSAFFGVRFILSVNEGRLGAAFLAARHGGQAAGNQKPKTKRLGPPRIVSRVDLCSTRPR